MPNKDIEKRARQLHSDMLVEIRQGMADNDFQLYRDRLGNEEYGGFKAREIEEMQDIRKVFDAQGKRRVFDVGKYSKLKEQLEKIKNFDLVEEVRKYEAEMRNIGYPVICREESMDGDATTSSSPVMVPPRRLLSSGPPITPDDYDPDDCYSTGTGYVLYISNFFYVAGKSEKPRPGVEVDKTNLTRFFKEERRFDMDFFPDIPTPERLWEVINVAKLKTKNSYNSFFFIISSHGKGITLRDESGNVEKDKDTQKPVVISESIQMVENDSHVRVDEIVSKFENFMIGKPKVLIFQACRSIADRADDSSGPVSFYDAQRHCLVTIPGNADMVVIHDTSRGCKGWRNEVHGAWLFDCMCVELKDKFNTEHLLDVLTRVNKLISARGVHNEGGKVVGKQMSCFTSTFTKFFYLPNR